MCKSSSTRGLKFSGVSVIPPSALSQDTGNLESIPPGGSSLSNIFAATAVTLFSTAMVFCVQPSTAAIPAETTRGSIPAESAGQLLSHDRSDLKLIDRIRNFSSYRDGWFNTNSIAPTSNTIEEAEKFIRNLDLRSINPPHISPAEDGEINFWWDCPDIMIDLGLYGKGTYSYYAKLKNGQEFMDDFVPLSQSLPSELLAELKKR